MKRKNSTSSRTMISSINLMQLMGRSRSSNNKYRFVRRKMLNLPKIFRSRRLEKRRTERRSSNSKTQKLLLKLEF